jgi:hypothetical protein
MLRLSEVVYASVCGTGAACDTALKRLKARIVLIVVSFILMTGSLDWLLNLFSD